MIKNPTALPPRTSAATRERVLSPPPEPVPRPTTQATNADAASDDRIERGQHSILDIPRHAPPPTAGTMLDPTTSPLPARQLYRAKGVNVVSYGADPEALREAGRAIGAVAANPAIDAALNREKVALVVIPQNRRMTDLPEFASLRGQQTFDGRLWDDVRGVGGLRLPDGRLAVGIPEENLANSSSDAYWGNYSVAIHELAHVVQDHCISDSAFDQVKRLYDARKRTGQPFTDNYAAANHFEYFAQATNAYFGRNEGQGISDPQWLATNDPALFRMLSEIYPQTVVPDEPELTAVVDGAPARSNGLLDLLRNNRTPGE